MVDYLTIDEIWDRELFFSSRGLNLKLAHEQGFILGDRKEAMSSTLERESDAWKKSLKRIGVAYEIVGQDSKGYMVRELTKDERKRVNAIYRAEMNQFQTERFSRKEGKAAVYTEE